MHRGFANLESFLSRHGRFIISTHESPDGDGLGAEIGFRELLTLMGRESLILNSDPVPDKFQFIDPEHEIIVYGDSTVLPYPLEEYAVFVLDTNDFDNVGSIFAKLRDRVKEVFIIDHHEGGRDKLESNFIKVEASSTCEIIYSLFAYFGMTPSSKSAQAIYAGMLFDTGSFRYPKTTPETFRIAGHLVELGADPFKSYEHIYENNSLASFALRAMILSTMEVHHGGRLIAMKLTPDMIDRSGASFSEGELAINMPLTVHGVVASILVKQDSSGPVKVSLRTKGDYDVAEIAIANGGGGHKNAAGYKSGRPFEETFLRAIGDMDRFFRD
ncbi:MAG: bifunctional oligoribonuclease/PAP phosphatase NrnA [Spirochaetes bacterium]|jgi:phosphoesterase RecJ-like protein|nr:bifunctional oligoribonuclease/PAP phosphatase NrnA [Spirochaetota bacterium]